jgi:hypothetical protein
MPKGKKVYLLATFKIRINNYLEIDEVTMVNEVSNKITQIHNSIVKLNDDYIKTK